MTKSVDCELLVLPRYPVQNGNGDPTATAGDPATLLAAQLLGQKQHRADQAGPPQQPITVYGPRNLPARSVTLYQRAGAQPQNLPDQATLVRLAL